MTPPGQAILVRGVETLKVMSPFLPDDERAQRLAALRVGELELTDLERKVLDAASTLTAEGKKVTNRAVYDVVGGNFNKLVTTLRQLKQLGMIQDHDDTNAEEN